MPISPDRMALYPGGSIRSPEWLAIRKRILARACGACEGTPQHPDCRAVNYAPHPVTGSRVVLTVAHMDGELVDHGDGNLRALCNRCHLSWDARQHAAAAAVTRHRKRGQPDLFAAPHTPGGSHAR